MFSVIRDWIFCITWMNVCFVSCCEVSNLLCRLEGRQLLVPDSMAGETACRGTNGPFVEYDVRGVCGVCVCGVCVIYCVRACVRCLRAIAMCE